MSCVLSVVVVGDVIIKKERRMMNIQFPQAWLEARHDNEGGEEKGETKSMIYGIR